IVIPHQPSSDPPSADHLPRARGTLKAPTRRRSCRPGNRAWSWKRQDRAVRAIPLAQADTAREVKQRLSDRFQAQVARGRERVTTARSDTTAAVTIAYLSPAQGL
ncbi:hypothetical protein Ctob_012687, partial [Chrysochromulina tobinii]